VRVDHGRVVPRTLPLQAPQESRPPVLPNLDQPLAVDQDVDRREAAAEVVQPPEVAGCERVMSWPAADDVGVPAFYLARASDVSCPSASDAKEVEIPVVPQGALDVATRGLLGRKEKREIMNGISPSSVRRTSYHGIARGREHREPESHRASITVVGLYS